jgi:hypothetical protein
MWWFFSKKKQQAPDQPESIWKQNFSECLTADFIPNYSVCQTSDNRHCRFVIMYSGMTLCSHPDHKKFIPKNAPSFDPHKGQF